MRVFFLALLMVSALAGQALAGLNVVATLPWVGSLAREIGKDKISVSILVKPSQDPHIVEAKPGMILAARKADLLMYNGLDLEIGYLPLIMESAKNPKILPGKPGNFDCSRFVKVLEKQTAVDRSMGDVHPLGNPHYHYSPSNILRVAEGMTAALSELDRADADFYRSNFQEFALKLKERQKEWHANQLQGKKFIAYHRLFEYLAFEFGFQITDYVEPKPGIPPSAGHIVTLMENIRRTKPDGLLTTEIYGMKESETLAAKTGIRVIVLPNDVGASGTTDWFDFMDKVLSSLK
ncbi:MAG: metal ABC transporter substrate-binding protein [bacterium]